MDNEGKEGSFTPIIIVMIASLAIAAMWESFPVIKSTAHLLLDPTAGVLLNWHLTYGMLLIILILTFFITLVQKYATDQKTLRELRKEQKILQGEMKQYKEHPEKLMELQKKQLEFLPRTMKLSMRGIVYTAVPLILFFRWFQDVFADLGNPKFFGFLGWIWFYILFSIIFSSILRKWMDVV